MAPTIEQLSQLVAMEIEQDKRIAVIIPDAAKRLAVNLRVRDIVFSDVRHNTFGYNTVDPTRFICTGCLRVLSHCKCGRALLNRCIGCGKKLWKQEGSKVWWGTQLRELCKECADKAPPTALVDGRK